MVQFVRVIAASLVMMLVMAAVGGVAHALEPVSVNGDVDAIDLLPAVESYSSQGDRLQVSTAPGADGIVRRIEVRAKEPGTRPNWIVFALDQRHRRADRAARSWRRISAWSAPA